jgi:hypothetical protein
MASMRVEQRAEALESTIRLQEERSEIIGAFRRELKKIRPRIEDSKTVRYAHSALSATDRFPQVDPLLLLAVGIVESRYDERAVSSAGALGIYQILPSTGRRLARDMGWDYEIDMLHDAYANTVMATRYLNELITEHDDLQLALAEYNGGPHNATHFKSGSGRLAEETRSYVPAVLGHYDRLLEDMATRASLSGAASSGSREIVACRVSGGGGRAGTPLDSGVPSPSPASSSTVRSSIDNRSDGER